MMNVSSARLVGVHSSPSRTVNPVAAQPLDSVGVSCEHPFAQERQEAFYTSVRGMGQAVVQHHAELFHETRRVSEEFAENGAFLPLGVWGNQGFDQARIESLTPEEDKRMHPILGLTYRVKLESTTKADKKEVVRGSTLTCRKKRKAEDDGVEDTPGGEPMLAIEDKASDDTSVSESSSSSSSSDSKKKKKKKKSKSNKKSKKHDKKKSKKDKRRGEARERDGLALLTCRIAAPANPHQQHIGLACVFCCSRGRPSRMFSSCQNVLSLMLVEPLAQQLLQGVAFEGGKAA